VAKLRHVIPKISNGINHNSAVGVVALLRNGTNVVYDVEFIFEKM
jgi:hypothetical protein